MRPRCALLIALALLLSACSTTQTRYRDWSQYDGPGAWSQGSGGVRGARPLAADLSNIDVAVQPRDDSAGRNTADQVRGRDQDRVGGEFHAGLQRMS